MKSARQALILDLIKQQEIETQDDLANALREHGVNATQATISRDIKELRLIKVQSRQGKYMYATAHPMQASLSDRLVRIFSEAVTSIEGAENIVVIKTLSGSASGAAEAVDNLPWSEIIGTLAGDNTILVVLESKHCMQSVLERFRALANR